MFLPRVAAKIGEGQDDHRETRRARLFGPGGRRRPGDGGRAHVERIDPDRLGDVLELDRAEIVRREIEPPLDLPIGLLGEADRAGFRDALDPRGDVDAIAHQITVALLDDIAEVNPDAKEDTAIRRR
jgi:hypothetical protein